MKKAVIFIAEGFEEIEAITTIDVLKRANIICNICALNNIYTKGAHDITVKADFLISEENFESYDCLILPGGMVGTKNLMENQKVIDLVREFNKRNKLIAAICAAPLVLEKAMVIENKSLTSYPKTFNCEEKYNYKEDNVVYDSNLITSRAPATALEFALDIVGVLAENKIKDNVGEAMLFYKS